MDKQTAFLNRHPYVVLDYRLHKGHKACPKSLNYPKSQKSQNCPKSQKLQRPRNP